jgi:hypothetical protein
LAACVTTHPDLVAHGAAAPSAVRCQLYDAAHGGTAR